MLSARVLMCSKFQYELFQCTVGNTTLLLDVGELLFIKACCQTQDVCTAVFLEIQDKIQETFSPGLKLRAVDGAVDGAVNQLLCET